MHDKVQTASHEDLIESIPKTQTVRERLAYALREARLLRQLLRVAERAEQERSNRKAVRDGQ